MSSSTYQSSDAHLRSEKISFAFVEILLLKFVRASYFRLSSLDTHQLFSLFQVQQSESAAMMVDLVGGTGRRSLEGVKFVFVFD